VSGPNFCFVWFEQDLQENIILIFFSIKTLLYVYKELPMQESLFLQEKGPIEDPNQNFPKHKIWCNIGSDYLIGDLCWHE